MREGMWGEHSGEREAQEGERKVPIPHFQNLSEGLERPSISVVVTIASGPVCAQPTKKA